MCGIFGYIGPGKAGPNIFKALQRLEYRGYDSAGIAVLHGQKVIIQKIEGKLSGLKPHLSALSEGHIGIGHTRWATHGKPTTANAHPHRVGDVILVHNGIIENFESLKRALIKKGSRFKSETDTEVACHLLSEALKKNRDLPQAFLQVLNQLDGSYSFVAMDVNQPDQFVAARKGSPLVIGLGEQENCVASDIPAILQYTKKVIFPENGEVVVVSANQVRFFNSQGKAVTKKPRLISWSAEMAEKSGYKHFMLKEIMEQSRSAKDTIASHVDAKNGRIVLQELEKIFRGQKYLPFSRIHLVACGTSWHAALCGKYYIEAMAHIPVNVDTASEFRYREPFLDKNTLLIVISQSGETADTLACAEEAREQGAKVVAICNVVDASIPRSSHATVYTHAGPEIGVASTKAFTTQLIVLMLIALYLGGKSGLRDKNYLKKAAREIRKLPQYMDTVLKQKKQIYEIAKRYCKARDFYFIARGVHYPIALEGALKLKEISYIHAEGYSAGEMKHGPIALIESGTPVVALAPDDRVCVKMISNIEEVHARGASVITLATVGDQRFKKFSSAIIRLPKTLWYVTPIVASLPLQLLAYYIADMKGADVDQPRNLAKSVTVE